MAEIVRCVWCIWAVWWFPDEETPRFGLWEPRILWVRFLSSTREAWSSLAVIKSPLRHKPHSCFGVPRVDQSQSQSGLQIALGGGGESGSRSKRRASDWTPACGALWLAVSAGGGGDGFLQLLRAQLSRAGLQQQVVAGVAHQNRVVQLLVWDGQLQLTAFLTKHVPTVPTGNQI